VSDGYDDYGGVVVDDGDFEKLAFTNVWEHRFK